MRAGEQGYAMVAAVAGMALFSIVSLTLVESMDTRIAVASAELGQAKASAAADAGIALALDGLLVADRANRWSIDGRTRVIRFDDALLQVRVEDERGKVPVNLLDDEFAQNLVDVIGLGISNRGRIVADSLLDWIDEDDVERPYGAEDAFYRSKGIRPRNGPLQSIDELGTIRGFDAAILDRLRPIITVHFGVGSFDSRFAQPLAIAVMQGGGLDNPAVIDRQRELDGQRPAIELGDDINLIGRPLMVVVQADRPDGSKAERRMVIELTGSKQRPYIVRWFQ